MKDLAKFALILLAGFLFIAVFPHEMAFVPHIPNLIWLSFVPLLFAIRLAATAREAFLTGYLFGVIVHSTLLIWLMSFGPAPVILLALVFSLVFAIICYFCWLMFERTGILNWWWIFPTFATAVLFFEGIGLWGFPWLYPAYALAKSPLLIQTADIGGVALVNWLVLLVNFCVFQLIVHIREKRVARRLLAVLCVVAVFVFCYGWARMRYAESGDGISVALIQGGIESDVEWTSEYNMIARNTYIAATERAIATGRADLIIWPEVAIGDILSRDYEYSIPLRVRLLPEKLGASLLMGALTAGNNAYYNSAMLLSETGKIAGVVDKSVLIAFGEVLPFRKVVRFIPFPWGPVDVDRMDSMSLITANLKDAEVEPLTVDIATAICFDSVKPYILRDKVNRGAQMIAIMTNNSWYKKPSGTEQHRMMDVFRAVENKRWTVRASTTGVSHIVDPAGRIVAETGQFRSASLIERIELLEGRTLYTRFGEWFGWTCIVCAIASFIWVAIAGESYDFF